jgi:photosystem II stability/assembly factor-like uncharacterized protein
MNRPRLSIALRLVALACAFPSLATPSLPVGATTLPPAWRPLDLFAQGDRLEDLCFVDERNGWVIDREGSVYRTRDGGASWELAAEFPAGHPPLRSVAFADTLNGWIGCLLANSPTIPVLYATDDGGRTWSGVSLPGLPDEAGFCGLSVSGNSVYAVGRYFGPPILARSHDRGQSWDFVDMSPFAGALVDVKFVTPDSGFLVGSTGGFGVNNRALILSTNDGGDSFDVRFTGTREKEQVWKIQFATPDTAYGSIQASHVFASRFLRSTNGGRDWTELPFRGPPSDPQGCGFVTGTHGWIGGYGLLYETVDAGATWEPSTIFTQFNRMRVVNDTLAYAVGARAYKYSITPATVPVALAAFSLADEEGAAVLRWQPTDDGARLLFHVHRALPDAPRERLTERPLGGLPRYEFVDAAPPGPRVDYWLEALTATGESDWYGPLRFEAAPGVRTVGLLSATPNPSSGAVRFIARLDRPAHAEFTVHDVLGRVVARQGPFLAAPGEQFLEWDGRTVDGALAAPGVYYARLFFDGEASSLKIVRTR